jgi:radical SAM superfamily enzyme with C-terminal helix-hairpin-helix motif
MITIIDCYTDEPSGLGVPPYLGIYPRYVFAELKKRGYNPTYLTIDDIRLWKKYNSFAKDKEKEMKTNIKIYNLTKNHKNVNKILKETAILVVIAGVNVPGKYLRAIPGTLKEISSYIKELECQKILTGPAALLGSSLQGGRIARKSPKNIFDLVDFNYLNINNYKKLNAELGSDILDQIPWEVIAEIETGRGCNIGKCSFCTEPLKSKVEYRDSKDIIDEIKALSKKGVKHFRIGKQTCFYSYKNSNLKEIEKILKETSKLKPKTFHIDNVNPNKVITEKGKKITELIVKHCTPGNVAAFGIESFDPEVIRKNTLNTSPIIAHKAIKIINKYGRERGKNGMPKFLPGLNLLFGLIGENKKTHKKNMDALTRILENNLLVRRLNVRQVTPYPGTKLFEEAKNKFLRKNRKYYWKWRNQIRHEFDLPMLKKVVPIGTILKDIYLERYDGKTTFGRQFGTYPLVVGIKGRHGLGRYCDVKVTGHMLRSITAEIIYKEEK